LFGAKLVLLFYASTYVVWHVFS